MDWQLVIDRNRTALLAIIVALMASLGLEAGGRLTTLPQFLVARALRILRPAESALRRLIMIAALKLTPRSVLTAKPQTTPADFVRRNPSDVPRLPTFGLIDRLKTFGQDTPDYSTFDPAEHDDPAHYDTAPMPADALGRRLLALKLALESIPRQAKRLARWYAQRDLALAQNQPHRFCPLRPGLAPASRRHERSEVGAVLRECHSLAIYAREHGAFPSLMEHQTLKDNATRIKPDSP